MIKGINEWKTFGKHISHECRCTFCGKKCNPKRRWNNCKCQCEYEKNIAFAKKTMPRILAYVLSSLKRIVTFVNTWKIAHAQSFVDDLVVTYDEIVKISEKTSINPNGKTNYWFIAVVLLAVTCQPLLMVIFVKCMKRVNFILIVTLWYRWVKQDKLISNILIQISSR